MNRKESFDTFSHEIKNTLTLIYSQLQYIEKTNANLLENETWTQVKADFVSLFSYLEHPFPLSSEIASSLECIDLMKLLREIENSWSYQFQLHHVDFHIHTSAEAPFYIYGPKSKYRQVFHNLISNSLKAILQKEQKNSPSFITIDLGKEGDYLVCSISDNGIGMTKNQQKRVFYRGVSFTPKGNGIGLAVVREIAEELQFSVQVDSKRNEGTTFTLIFPGMSDTK